MLAIPLLALALLLGGTRAYMLPGAYPFPHTPPPEDTRTLTQSLLASGQNAGIYDACLINLSANYSASVNVTAGADSGAFALLDMSGPSSQMCAWLERLSKYLTLGHYLATFAGA